MSATNANLAALTANALTALYNGAVDDYAPEGFAVVERFKSKGAAIERIERMCEAGSLAVSFDGDTATIVDAMEAVPEGDDADDAAQVMEGDDTPTTESEAEGDDTEADNATAYGDGKGEVATSGFRRASGDWLKANARGSAEREEYRKARRKAAREARKAGRAAKEAALNEAASA